MHEGYFSQAEAKRREKANAPEAAKPKTELTKAAQAYVDLHRHAALQADLLQSSSTALRLIAAHMICGSSLWDVEADAKKAPKPEIARSLNGSTAQQALDAEIAEVEALLGLDTDDHLLARQGQWYTRPDLGEVYAKLKTLDDDAVLRILTLLMAQSLSVTNPLIDTLGLDMETDLSEKWSPDETFVDLIRNKQVLDGMIAELAGDALAEANITKTAKTKRTIISDCLNGTRSPVNANWMPRYMAFPSGTYRDNQERDAGKITEGDQDEVIEVDAKAA